MKEHPILFSAPMVRAILNSSKTQTRRAAKLTCAAHVKETGGHRRWHPSDPEARLACPYGQPGDRLWVREAWRVIDLANCLAPREITAAHRIWFDADGPHEPPAGRYRPGMFMPRWASRILLEVTSVRVEKLQDISEADCVAEGCLGGHGAISGYAYNATPYEHYHWLWNSINGKGEFEKNPFVWVIEFKRVTA